MPSVKKIKCTSGLVHFTGGVGEQLVEDFLAHNKIKRVEGTPKWMTSGGIETEEEIDAGKGKYYNTIRVPEAEEYVVPDHVWIWVERDMCN